MLKRSLICATALFSLALAGCDMERAKTMCPALKTYSRAQLARLADEFAALPTDVRGLINDYRLLRKECEAISK
jgi:hypothetical protein